MADDVREERISRRKKIADNLREREYGRDRLFREAEKLLNLAEDWQDRCERNERRYVMTWFCLGLMGISGLIAASLFFPDSLTEKWPFHKQFLLGLGICSYVVSILVFGADMLLKVRRRINRDRRAYLEIVDMLRELRGLFERKSLSTRLESAEFLIRLARLDIGPGTTFSNMLFGVRLRESKYPSSSEAMKSMSEAYAIEAIELEKLNAQIREESSTPVKNNPVVVTKHKNNP